MKKYNKWIHYSIWSQFETKYDIGILKDFDSSGHYQDIIARYNPINKIDNEILSSFDNGLALAIVKRLNGSYDIIQLSGYHNEKGMVCYLVDEEGKLTKA